MKHCPVDNLFSLPDVLKIMVVVVGKFILVLSHQFVSSVASVQCLRRTDELLTFLDFYGLMKTIH